MRNIVMGDSHLFLVSYILNNQPKTAEIRAETDRVSVDQARVYLEALHAVSSSNDISDIQVMGIHHHRPHQTPGHYQQQE
jgi:hypothetical protein